MTFMGNLVRNAETGAGGVAAPAPAPAPATLSGAAALSMEPKTAAAPTLAPAPAPAAPWWDNLPEPLKNTAAAKNWKDPAAAVESYVNLEKIMGADAAGRTVMLPKADATPDEIGTFYKSLGVPEKAEQYELKVPQGLQQEVVDNSKAWMHEAGVPPALEQRLVDAVAKAEAAKMAEWEKASKQEMNDMALEWGAKFDDNAEVARRAFRHGGLTADQVEKVEMAIGTKTMMTMFHKLGVNLGEAEAPAPGQGGGQFVMNKAEASRRLSQLQASPEFQARHLSPNIAIRQTAISEMEELTKIMAS
jgi:hypothetical protein